MKFYVTSGKLQRIVQAATAMDAAVFALQQDGAQIGNINDRYYDKWVYVDERGFRIMTAELKFETDNIIRLV